MQNILGKVAVMKNAVSRSRPTASSEDSPNLTRNRRAREPLAHMARWEETAFLSPGSGKPDTKNGVYGHI